MSEKSLLTRLRVLEFSSTRERGVCSERIKARLAGDRELSKLLIYNIQLICRPQSGLAHLFLVDYKLTHVASLYRPQSGLFRHLLTQQDLSPHLSRILRPTSRTQDAREVWGKRQRTVRNIAETVMKRTVTALALAAGKAQTFWHIDGHGPAVILREK